MWVRRQLNGVAAAGRGALLATAAVAACLLIPDSAVAAPPVIKATWATEVTASSFRARAILATEGLTSTYRFDYLPLSAYEANLRAGHEGFLGALHSPIGVEAKVLGSPSDEEVAQRVAGLSSEVAYRYRIVARNASGETVGPDRTVTTQEEAPTFELAEGRGWEMVSPVDKNGGQIARPESLFGGGDFQAAEQGGSVTYGSAFSFAGARGAPGASQYVSVRTPSGWTTQNVTLPTEAGAFGAEPDGSPYRIFSSDLSKALALTRLNAFALLAMPAATPLDSMSGPALTFAGATGDLSQTVFSEGGNLYRRSAGAWVAINIEPGDTAPTPSAELASQGANAISADGTRIYWVDHEGALMLRDSNRTVEVDPEGAFQVASSDGSIAYFTKGGHLYRFALATEASTDLTPSGGVAGVLGASADGSYLYFQDGSGVELWHQGAITPVAPGASAAAPSDYPPAAGTTRVSADGQSLAFLSQEDLTGYEGLGASELYLYQADSSRLLCVSCNPTGSRPLGPTTIPGAVANGEEVVAYRPRVMIGEGTRLFFDSGDALIAKDTNGKPDVYEWRAQGVGGCQRQLGCQGIISSGKAADASTFVDASADGTDAFFLASDSLVESDPGGLDLYDARIGGGFPVPPKPIPCIGDACQPLPPEPEDPTPGTMFIGSEGNPELHLPGRTKKKKHRRHHRHHHRTRHHKHAGAGNGRTGR
ncbi:MAG TPA: hypothetical protein VFN85_01410 [Solirubrobacterales bacterium]|nr:hypothetical protein [Solirubrobacterales bacterium]